jgi:hypothetical protein
MQASWRTKALKAMVARMPEHGLNHEKRRLAAKGLVALTTCARPRFVRAYLPALIDCTRECDDLDLVVAIDGLSVPGNREAQDLALAMGVDCVVADEAEGVGISKNRVLSLLGGYDYYFFIEDDVEVLSAALFTGHIEAHLKTGIHHFSLHEPERLLQETGSTRLDSGELIRHAKYGSAQVNFFSRQALLQVGGWYAYFGRIRRGGHTEHSYRIYRANLCPEPFNFIAHLAVLCRWHNPPAVISSTGLPRASNRLFEVENDLIAEHLTYWPFSALHAGRLLQAKRAWGSHAGESVYAHDDL